MVLGPLVEPNDEPSAIRTQWMSSLDDSTQLSQLSIPGSHNSASYNCKDEWNLRNSQLMSLLRQLDIGIRALDFRYAFHKNKITLSHYPDQGLEEVIHDLKIWLESHPSETIFVSLSPDTASSQDKNAQQLMKALLDNTANSWIKNPTTRTTLGEARGKLILLQGFPSDEPRGLDISKVQPANSPYFYLTLDSHLETVEDLDLLRGFPRDAEQQIDLKLDSVIAHLERAQKASMEGADRLHVTYTGETADGSDSQLKGDVNPRVLALGRGEFSAVNKNLAEWLNHSSKRPIGIVFMDYAGVQTGEKNDAREDGNDLIQAIINMNRFA
ncbi:PLC-like phosphodiesterase [Serendipita vermifera]|nr:PLC-like phosphodiesterase [Serendipita vermifera]